MPGPKIGRVVKDFTATTTGDQRVRLKDLRGGKVVIYFYPKDATPGCTTEGRDFRDLSEKFRRTETTIFGVSRDSVASHEKFKEKQGFPFALISDENGKLCEYFDVIKEKNMYGRKYMGIERSTFLIDEHGKLREEWRKVRVKGHAAAVLEAAKLL